MGIIIQNRFLTKSILVFDVNLRQMRFSPNVYISIFHAPYNIQNILLVFSVYAHFQFSIFKVFFLCRYLCQLSIQFYSLCQKA